MQIELESGTVPGNFNDFNINALVVQCTAEIEKELQHARLTNKWRAMFKDSGKRSTVQTIRKCCDRAQIQMKGT